MQEHKLSLEEGKKYTKQVEFPRGLALWNEASYCAATDSFKGGTSFLLSARIANLICEHGVIVRGRAQYVTIQVSPHVKVGIINVYAFNYTGSRKRLWNKISQYPLPAANWILGGDFNMIEQLSDEQGGQDTTGRGRRELIAWNGLLVQLGLQDCFKADEFRKVTPKLFSWDIRRAAPGMICSKLDRFYLNQTLTQIGGQTAIWPTLSHVSDHAPIFVKKQPRPTKPPHQLAFNRHLLSSEEEKTPLLELWNRAISVNPDNSWNTRFVTGLKAIKEYSDQKTRSHRIQRREAFTAQLAPVFTAEMELQRDWNDQQARETLNKAQMDLHQQRQKQLEAKHDRHMSEWTRIGDRCNKEFFEFHTGYKKPAPVRELINNGSSLTNHAEMQSYVDSFYINLYSRDMVEANQEARQNCFTSVPRCVTRAQGEKLLLSPCIQEVIEAVKSLPSGKAPGLDGVPIEFFKTFLDETGPNFLDLIKEIFASKSLCRALNTSKIRLLSKN